MGKLGTKEWAIRNFNIAQGCPNGCTYCYACRNAIRFKRVKNREEWMNGKLVAPKPIGNWCNNPHDYVMYPSSHDIWPEIENEYCWNLAELLAKGNNVLIVTKPRVSIIQRICGQFANRKDKILFRFTIGGNNERALKFFEAEAPTLKERLKALSIAKSSGFRISVSMEPLLMDPYEAPKFISPLIESCESIWVGIMTNIPVRQGFWFKQLTDWYTIDKLEWLADFYSKSKTIKFKDSIRNIIANPRTSQKLTDFLGKV